MIKEILKILQEIKEEQIKTNKRLEKIELELINNKRPNVCIHEPTLYGPVKPLYNPDKHRVECDTEIQPTNKVNVDFSDFINQWKSFEQDYKNKYFKKDHE